MEIPTDKKPRLSTWPELKQLGVPHSRRQVDRLEAANQFPKRVAIGDYRVAWVTEEIVAHVEARIAARVTAVGSLGSAHIKQRQTRTAHVAPMLGVRRGPVSEPA
jgi:prophage regulatory protein